MDIYEFVDIAPLFLHTLLRLGALFPTNGFSPAMHKMKTFFPLLCSLAALQTLVTSASIPRYLQKSPTTRRYLNVTQVQRELGSRVSNTTVIFGPNDNRYNESTTRWNIFAVPKIQVVVEPSQETDISTIVSTRRVYLSKAVS